jgi:DNA-binding SARP family transcriptional activator
MSVRTFGGFEVLLGEQKAEARGWGFAKTRELFVLLLLHPEGKTREQVGLSLWPDASAGQVRNNFHVAMHHLRRALGDGEWVRFDGDRYRLTLPGSATFDARSFETRITELLRVARRDLVPADAWREVLAMHRGAFLDGATAGDWHLEWRDRFSRLYARGLEQCGGSLLREGRLEEAEETFERLVREEPLDEAGYRGLVTVRARAGDVAAAERDFRRYEDVLRAEGMGAPAASMRSLVASVRRGESP